MAAEDKVLDAKSQVIDVTTAGAVGDGGNGNSADHLVLANVRVTTDAAKATPISNLSPRLSAHCKLKL